MELAAKFARQESEAVRLARIGRRRISSHRREAVRRMLNLPDTQPRRALATLRARITDLRERATLTSDEQIELERLATELARALGLGGRARNFADAPERARTAVCKAIKRTGSDCCYRSVGGS